MDQSKGLPTDWSVSAFGLETAQQGQIVQIRPRDDGGFTLVVDFAAPKGRAASHQTTPLGVTPGGRVLISKTLELEHDPLAGQVFLRGKALKLRAQEYKLLCFMFRHPRHLLTDGQLLDGAWEDPLESQRSALETCISKLRRYRPGEAAGIIETCRGQGYRFNPDAEPR